MQAASSLLRYFCRSSPPPVTVLLYYRSCSPSAELRRHVLGRKRDDAEAPLLKLGQYPQNSMLAYWLPPLKWRQLLAGVACLSSSRL